MMAVVITARRDSIVTHSVAAWAPPPVLVENAAIRFDLGDRDIR
jgi:hypothetical protein